MSRPNPVVLFGFLVSIIVVLGGLAVLKGGLFIAKHEADTLHLVQIVFRMNMGQWPHLDFMTPLGALAYAPIALFTWLGAGIGHAILYAQIMVAAVLLPAVWWVGVSRFTGWLAYLFGALVMILCVAIAFGTEEQTISISMHYNRWAWAFSFVPIALAVVPPQGRGRPLVDGVIIGLCLAVLALIKVTYFISFAPAIALALALRKDWAAMGWALVAGAGVVVIVTLFAGIGFWFAYAQDLIEVAGSKVRPQPGLSISRVILSSAYLGATAMAVLGAVLYRQSKEDAGGYALLALLPGFIYVTYQNYGNDPQWLPLLAILFLALRPKQVRHNRWGWDIRKGMEIAAIATFAMAAPSYINMASSPIRQMTFDVEEYESILMTEGVNSDLQLPHVRARRVDGWVSLASEGAGLDAMEEGADRKELGSLSGQPLPYCKLKLGLPGWTKTIVDDLESAGFAGGNRIFIADIFSSHWLYGDLKPLINGAPWYYGGLPGFGSADYVLVPQCPASPEARKQILDDIMALEGVTVKEIRRTPLYILLDIKR
ncbi:hypothetical protein [Profundibacter sp.]